MKIRDFAFQPGHYSEGKGLTLHPLVKCTNFRTRQVCANCNNGWMSNLESWAKGKIGFAVAPDLELDAIPQLAMTKDEMDILVRWLLKTAIIFELAAPRGDLDAVNKGLYPVAAAKTPATDFHVWAGFVAESNFLVELKRGFPVWNGGKLQPYQIHAASMDFGLQLNHLALRLIRCPEANPIAKLSHIAIDPEENKFHSVPFILPNPKPFPCPHTYLFRDFNCFLDTLEVNANPGREG